MTNDCNQILDDDDLRTVLAALDPFHDEHGLKCCYDSTEGTITIQNAARLTAERLAAIRDALPMGWEADWHPECRAELGTDSEAIDVLLVNVGAIADTLVRGLDRHQRAVLVSALTRACESMPDGESDRDADMRIRGVLEHLRPHADDERDGACAVASMGLPALAELDALQNGDPENDPEGCGDDPWGREAGDFQE